MAETLQETLGHYRSFIAGLTQFSDEVSTTLALNAAQLVNARIVDTGIDSKGKPLENKKNGKDYSDTELSAAIFYDAAIPLPKSAVKGPPFISYVDYKKAVGRYRGHRDLMLTGAMWKNTGLTAKQVTRGGFVATVAGRTDETQRKLDSNSSMAGVDVLELSTEEEDILAADLDDELQQYMDRSGL